MKIIINFEIIKRKGDCGKFLNSDGYVELTMYQAEMTTWQEEPKTCYSPLQSLLSNEAVANNRSSEYRKS